MSPEENDRRGPLDRVSVVAGGIALADEEGVDSLTMRRLADRLGFKVMTLYNHIASKDELLEQMVDAVAGEIEEPAPSDPPLGAVRAFAMSTRTMFVRHRWAPALWLSHLPGPNRKRHMETLLRTLAQSGLSHDLAHHGYHAVSNHVLGYTLQELAMDFDAASAGAMATARQFAESMPREEYPYAVAHVEEHLSGDTDSSFELVLDLILDGLVRLDEER